MMLIELDDHDYSLIKTKALQWGDKHFKYLCFLDSNLYASDQLSKYDCLIACSNIPLSIGSLSSKEYLFKLYEDQSKSKKWIFGHLSYDFKNHLEKLSSKNKDLVKFPETLFFEPEVLLKFRDGKLEIEQSNELEPAFIWDQICLEMEMKAYADCIQMEQGMPDAYYFEAIQSIKKHIADGDIYEMNFCQEFFKESIDLNVLELFQSLNKQSAAPFSAFYKIESYHVLCFSPERYICKRKNRIYSQPIKGTISRNEDPEIDIKNKNSLSQSEKDRAENVMIVDLVRNDLSRICRAGSIKVDELFGVYAFNTVYQMISTISGELSKGTSWADVICNTFPMGSMTGAPKIKAMELIERYETSKRGIYSGTIGYIDPDGDFDFNVVIRSLVYNAKNKYLSLQVGGAIVYDSIKEAELEECLLKVEKIQKILSGK